MPFDDRKKWVKQLHELNTREARRTHPGTESTDPPPPPPRPPPRPPAPIPEDASWPPRPIEGQGSPSATIRSDPLPKVERKARWLKVLLAIGGGFITLGSGMCGAGKWTLMQAKVALDERVDERCAALATSAAASVASTIAPPGKPSHEQRLKELEKKERKNGARWDALDEFHVQKFQRPNLPKVKKFGPAAEAHGGATPLETDE